jgi:hypothetical protein
VGFLSLDLLTRVRNIHWKVGGGEFVNGGGAQRYLKMGKSHAPGRKWTDLGSLAFTAAGTSQASSYALVGTPPVRVFLLGGNDGGTEETSDNGLIMVSNDGLIWSKMHTVATGDDFNTASLLGIVWDKTARCFYAGAHIFTAKVGGDLLDEDILLQSFDGRRWDEIERVGWATAPDAHIEGLLAKHCSKRVTDSYGNGVPDGVYGFDETKDILIAPTGVPRINYTDGLVRSEPLSTVTIKTRAPSGTEITTTVDVGILVNCVAYAGGIWMAGGTALTDLTIPMTAYSIDDGATWTKIIPEPETEPQEIVTMCAAAKTVASAPA